MELRDVEIFLAVAEELHFGRAAERLRVTPARVSQSIKKLERQVGGPLFQRTSRRVATTAIGQQLYEELRPHYRGLHESLARAAQAATGTTEVLRLGMIASNLNDIRPLLDEFALRRPDCQVRVTHQHFSDPFGALRRDEIDLQLTWLPVNEPDLTVGPEVYAEPVVLAVAADHPLAARPDAHYEDLADYPQPAVTAPDYWIGAVSPFHTPAGRPISRGPAVANFQELITAVAAGQGICVVHAHARRYYARPDIRYLTVAGLPWSRWALVWRTAGESPLVRAFAETSEEFGPLDVPR
ncbi:LysR family transcriptional regulator [Rugosimonospora acidiphila]